MFKAITAKEAEKILKRQGMGYGQDGTTFYAYDDEYDAVYAYDSKRERDEAVKRNEGK